MEPIEPDTGSKRFGSYLRRVREGRKLSLDAVEEMSTGFPERLTKSHLSRIETGQALPTFPRLFALSRIYGVPVASLAERFELELQREMMPVDAARKTDEQLTGEARGLIEAGRYLDALLLLSAALDARRERPEDGTAAASVRHFRLGQINCLVRLGRYESAKTECEEILNAPGLSPDERLMALQFFVTCCFNLGRYTVAMMGLEEAEKDLARPGCAPRMKADLAMIRGNLLATTQRHDEALAPYGQALAIYEELSNRFEACRTRINMAFALMESRREGRARELLEQTLSEAESAGYDRQKALALSHLAVLRYRQDDLAGAETYALRSNAVARPREYVAVVFRNCYYLWQIARHKGDEPGVKAHERTLRSYVGRIEENLPELEAFRQHLAGGAA